MRRRAVARTAAIGGAAYYGGKRGQEAAQREADQAAIAALQAQAAQAPEAPAAPTMDDKVQQLRQLSKLRDDGILTEDEFAAQKQQILGS
jgi:hypothetical protein